MEENKNLNGAVAQDAEERTFTQSQVEAILIILRLIPYRRNFNVGI